MKKSIIVAAAMMPTVSRYSARYRRSMAVRLTGGLSPCDIFQQVYFHFGLIESDPDDNKFVDCAVAVDAEYIVTNDTHFNILKHIDWPRPTIIDIKEFTNQLEK